MGTVTSANSHMAHGFHERINSYTSGGVRFHVVGLGENPYLLCFLLSLSSSTTEN